MRIQLNSVGIAAVVFFAACAVFPLYGQKARSGKVKKSRPTAAQESAKPTPPPVPGKRNERPGSDASDTNSKVVTPSSKNAVPTFRYEFSRPDFVVTKITIEHDERGLGTIGFMKKGDDELITDPLTVSPMALARINEALDTLDFLGSNEDYQYEKDYSHLGNIKFALSRNGKSREVAYNYTTNKAAKALMDEYRKIGNQYIWIFDIKLSRENQPLESPRLMDSLDSMIRRDEISDPYQLEPFLRELANDESIPLIARNHADRLAKQIEKEKAREEKKKNSGKSE
ncbi:MAG: hypothetical protein IT174_02185 [Acidobacteria bacterium]|nr:hypothetical protein [Acidobacteriota bacterium]